MNIKDSQADHEMVNVVFRRMNLTMIFILISSWIVRVNKLKAKIGPDGLLQYFKRKIN